MSDKSVQLTVDELDELMVNLERENDMEDLYIDCDFENTYQKLRDIGIDIDSFDRMY